MSEKAYVQTRDGTVVEIPKAEVRSKLESGDYLPATAADKAAADKADANSTLGAKAKTFAESAAAAAIDTAQAPIALPLRANAALWGDEDPLKNFHGRQTVENAATLFGDLREGATGKTGEAYAREYAENARARAEANPGTALAGNVAGSLVTGTGLAGGAGAIGRVAASALGEGLAARATGALATGALEGAAYGQAQAGEEAYIHNIPLTGEKLIAAMGWGAVLGGGVSLAAHGAGGLLRRGSRGATPLDSPRLPVQGEEPLDAGLSGGRPLPSGQSFDGAATAVGELARESGSSDALDRFLNHDRRSISEAERTGAENATSEKVTSFLHEAQARGATYDGPVYRGTNEAELEQIRKNGRATHTLSVSQDLEGADAFSKKGGVLLEIKDHPVPVDGVEGSNTFSEALIPKDSPARIIGEREEGGRKIVTLQMGTDAAEPPAATASAAPEVPSSRLSSGLRTFADERTAKALGARGSTLKALGRTAEQAEQTMHDMARTVRGMMLDDGTAVFRPLDSQGELAERVLQAKRETGAKLGAFREQADQVFEAHPEIAPKPEAIADRIEKEIVSPLEGHPLSASRAQASPIRQVVDDIRALGAHSANDNSKAVGVGISDLTKLRQGLDDQIYQAKRGVNLTQQGAPPNLKDLERARGILEESIEAASDKAATFFDKGAAQSYKQLKAQWRHLNLASDIAGAAELQNLGNRVVSPSDYGVGAAGAVLGGNPVTGILSGIAHHAIRERSSAVLAVLADKLANNLDGKIESGLGAFFRESVARASASTAGLDKVASAVPLRRITTPAAVDAFTGKSKDLRAAYEKRVAELVDANRDMGAGVRASMQSAMGGASDTMPRLTQAATVTATKGAQYLESQLPGGTAAPTVFQPTRKTSPSDLQIREFAQKWAAVANPLSVLDDLRRGTVTHAQIDALKAVYPELYAEVQGKALDKIRELDAQGKRMPFNDRLQLDLFLDLNGAGEPTLAGKFVDRVTAMQAAKAQQDAQPKQGRSSPALGKIGATRQSGAQQVLGG